MTSWLAFMIPHFFLGICISNVYEFLPTPIESSDTVYHRSFLSLSVGMTIDVTRSSLDKLVAAAACGRCSVLTAIIRKIPILWGGLHGTLGSESERVRLETPQPKTSTKDRGLVAKVDDIVADVSLCAHSWQW